MSKKPKYGSIGWMDLTTGPADEIKTFYEEVAGWSSADVSMGDYNDFNMLDEDGTPVAGICHAKGVNKDIPSQWLMYINIPDLDQSLTSCLARGGKIIKKPTTLDKHGRYSIIQDPAGAIVALFEPAN